MKYVAGGLRGAHYALFQGSRSRQCKLYVASTQYIDFVEIVNEADMKDNDGDPFTDLDGAEVVELESLENLRITSNNN